MTIETLINSFLSNLRNVSRYSENTLLAYTNDLAEFEKYCVLKEKLKISGITERFLKSYLMFLNEKEFDKKTISRKLAAIRSLFRYAFQNDMIEENPVLLIKNPKSKRKLPEIISDSAFPELLNNVEKTNEKPELVTVIFEILYGSALRVSELCDLKYKEYNSNKGQFLVTGKGNKTRIVPVGEKTMLAISKYLELNPVSSKNDYLIRTKKMINSTQDLFIELLTNIYQEFQTLKRKALIFYVIVRQHICLIKELI
ncbi:MAG: site-specific integrase [Ignavibacterium sp.]|nr:site-specific integrase [Ignavibacterium sp.]